MSKRPLSVVFLAFVVALLAMVAMAGCLPQRAPRATPTPHPMRATFTPTPPKAKKPGQVAAATPAPSSSPLLLPTPVPPSATPEPATKTPAPTATSEPTVTPMATAAPNYSFALEASEQFPAQVPEAEGVRVYLYVYSLAEFGLPGYSLRVLWNDNPMAVDTRSTGGLPKQTRSDPGSSTRLANLQAEFKGPLKGTWQVQLVDQEGNPAGPPAVFTLQENDPNRELYVRYRESP